MKQHHKMKQHQAATKKHVNTSNTMKRHRNTVERLLKRRQSHPVFFMVFLAIVLLYVLIPQQTSAFVVVSDVLPIVLSLGAALLGFAAYRMHGLESYEGKALFFLSVGVLVWFVGELTWGVYELVLGVMSPFPSLADVAWVAGYPLIVLGFVFMWILCGREIRLRNVFAFSLATFAVFVALAVWLFVPIAFSEEVTLVEKLLDLAYPLGDFLILLLAGSILPVFGHGKIRKSFGYLIVGFSAITLADILFSYLTFNDLYYTSSNFASFFTDLLWIAGYLVIAEGFYYEKLVWGVSGRVSGGVKGGVK